MTTHEDVQFSQAERFGFGISRPACLTGRWVIDLDETSVVASLKRSGRKYFYKASSTGWNAPTM